MKRRGSQCVFHHNSPLDVPNAQLPDQSKLLELTLTQPPAQPLLPPNREHSDVEKPRLNVPLSKLLSNDTAYSGESGEIVEDGVEYL